MRLFVAVGFPDDVRTALGGVQDRLEPVPLPVRWVRRDALHLTLKFLGETSEADTERAGDVVADVAMRWPPMLLELGGVGTFPARGGPRVIWMGVRQDRTLLGLQSDLEASLDRVGFERDTKRFRPHVTLGRVRRPMKTDQRRALARAGETENTRVRVRVDRVDVMESRLAPGGARYRVVRTCELDLDRGVTGW